MSYQTKSNIVIYNFTVYSINYKSTNEGTRPIIDCNNLEGSLRVGLLFEKSRRGPLSLIARYGRVDILESVVALFGINH